MSFSLSLCLSWQASWVYYRSEKFSPYWTPTIRQSPPRRLPPHRPPTPPPCRPGPRPRRGLPCHMCEREISLKIGQNRTFTVLQRRLWMLHFLCLCLCLCLCLLVGLVNSPHHSDQLSERSHVSTTGLQCSDDSEIKSHSVTEWLSDKLKNQIKVWNAFR